LPAAKPLVEVAQGLPKTAWRNITWRQGTQGPMRSRFAQVKVWAAHGWKRQEHPRRVMEWLLIEWPEDAVTPTDYWLAQLGEQSLGLRRLVKTARARWRVEMDYRELKAELGLDHYEGRSWLGWHHHVTLVSMAFAFLRTEQAQVKKLLVRPWRPGRKSERGCRSGSSLWRDSARGVKPALKIPLDT
jgi:SRSO17 transposase